MNPKMYVSLAIQENNRQAKITLPLASASIVVMTFKMYLWKTWVYIIIISSFILFRELFSCCYRDKHVVNKHRVTRKGHDDISMYHVIGLKQVCCIKNVNLKTAKKFVGVALYWEE